MKNTVLYLFLLLFVACGQPETTPEGGPGSANVENEGSSGSAEKDYSYLDDEIARLDNNVKIREYWENIENADQLYRRSEASVLQQHGYNSKEYQKMKKDMQEADEENFEKTDRMLVRFGYPRRDSLGPRAANAAYLVMSHAPDYEFMERNFHYFYNAYKNGSLKEGPFSFLVNRMYDLKTGKYFAVSGSFNEAERIEAIIKELGLVNDE